MEPHTSLPGGSEEAVSQWKQQAFTDWPRHHQRLSELLHQRGISALLSACDTCNENADGSIPCRFHSIWGRRFCWTLPLHLCKLSQLICGQVLSHSWNHWSDQPDYWWFILFFHLEEYKQPLLAECWIWACLAWLSHHALSICSNVLLWIMVWTDQWPSFE